MEKRPVRKTNRLPCYDYTAPGYYFVTVCTADRKQILGGVTKADEAHRSTVLLSRIGVLTNEAICAIPGVYPGVTVEKYVIMPNHFHMILVFSEAKDPVLSLSRVIQQTKRRVSKSQGGTIWQAHYYDHVIRDEADFKAVWEYIDNNPTKWSLDQYFYED